jgi:hypothetical protein
MPIRHITLVATDATIEAAFGPAPTHTEHGTPGIRSARFEVDTDLPRSRLGKWLAERLLTTRRDDDQSALSITLHVTEEALHVREMAKKLSTQNPQSTADAERIFGSLETWIEQRRSSIKAYGDTSFAQRTIAFDWPVLGSLAAEKVQDPNEYLNICASRIRALKPVSARLASETIPDGFLR